MELKWLEDFISLAETRSFSRSAQERNVTQSAFSRRIQALELWLGVSLVDRSTYPTTLTAEGKRFRETAEEAVRMLKSSRADLLNARASTQIVSVAALHTLSLTFFPGWFKQIEKQTGPLASRLLPDDFHNCLQALVEGGYDFLLTFHHPSAPILLETDLYPHLVLGSDELVQIRSAASSEDEARSLPLLGYAKASFLGRIAAVAQGQDEMPAAASVHVNENAMAEALKFMVLAGHGKAWVPHCLVARELAAGDVVASGPRVPLQIRLYRNGTKRRAVVEQVWSAASAMAETVMQNGNTTF
ncbi:LysR family transcriptional regulator [Bradyrhizobium sp. CB82]|uniref:LysR family transcriptional regulator n=1 Tax=Bradyrhizobium sp. CB82 TaxID=3039159 RepID=UPI0024B19002|nr:LysR family transcriptional regulator [Bradyrhizobium sp. CB82]WFU37854.1 LysR family transcriptional regulator [Bradyrhizobium sp. CB82]